MAERMFRPYDPNLPLPLPADLRQWLPTDHTVYLLGDIVDQLDLSAITSVYDQGDGGGNPPYHPVLLTKLLFYAYSQGVVSSRVIAQKTYEDVAFRVLTCDQHPDFRTISDFRERHLSALVPLFKQVVRLAGRLGLVKLEHVAQDGSKVLANASKHRAMSYARMKQTEERLGKEIQALLEAARAADAAENAEVGPERTGDELPEDLSRDLRGEVARRERRLSTIREAKEALEREAREAAEAVRAADEAERVRRAEAGEPKKPGKRPEPSELPRDEAQANFTDPDSRIMKNSDKAFVQAYNAQAAVDASGYQIIVGCAVTNQAADAPHLEPMVEQVQEVTGGKPKEWSSDAGYFSAPNVAALAGQGIEAFIPPDRQRHSQQPLPAGVARALEAAGLGPPGEVDAVVEGVTEGPPADESAVKAAMRAKLRTESGRAAYALRKQTVEPVFGQIKERRGLRRFSLRGLVKVSGEWTLWCLTHNLGKIVRALRTVAGLRERLVTAMA
jgi:transposase